MSAVDPEAREGHAHAISHVLVEGHGLADTSDGELSGSMARAELERRTCLDCDGAGMQRVCRTCEGQGWEMVPVHVCNGDESICFEQCPEPSQEQCRDC